jgi:hypothetical protein
MKERERMQQEQEKTENNAATRVRMDAQGWI